MNNPAAGQEVGRVKALFRYPVKSMRSESLDSIEVGFHGLVGDRRWAFVRAGLERSGFPWLTIREKPEMWHYQPRFEEPERPDHSVTVVRTPSGDEFDVVDPALAEELGFGARVIKQSLGVFDTFPLSLITTQTIGSLGSIVGTQLNRRRFRPNFLIEATTDETFPEDQWVGGILKIGGISMRIDKRDKRCVVINVDPV
ncbi:MAG: MOSC N-terminal beta barrel domain-containing protein, partial [Gemmatimonadales bacterium]